MYTIVEFEDIDLDEDLVNDSDEDSDEDLVKDLVLWIFTNFLFVDAPSLVLAITLKDKIISLYAPCEKVNLIIINLIVNVVILWYLLYIHEQKRFLVKIP